MVVFIRTQRKAFVQRLTSWPLWYPCWITVSIITVAGSGSPSFFTFLQIPFQNQVVWGRNRTYKYDLVGLEHSWHTWDPNLSLSLAKLPVGTCHLRWTLITADYDAWWWMNREDYLLPAVLTGWQGGCALNTVVNSFQVFCGFLQTKRVLALNI